MKDKLLIILALCLSIYLLSCEKMMIAKDVQTSIKGHVIDEIKNTRVANINVNLYGLKTTLIQGALVDSIGTVRTNANGDFEYTFTADGQYNEYQLEVRDYQRYLSYEKYVLEAGKHNTVIIKLRERTNVFFKLKIRQTTAESFVLYDYHRYHHFQGKPLDTVLVFKCRPNAINNFSLEAKYANKNNRRFLKDYYIGTKDTTIVETIDNTDLLPTIR